MADDTLPIIGWKERIELPEWGLSSVLTKIDTGAQTSSIDATDIEVLPRGRIRFQAVGRRARPEDRATIEADVLRMGNIRSSNGRLAHRYVVVTRVHIGDQEFLTEFTLAPRPRMKCRVLLGRAALEGRFLVDTEHSYLLSQRPKRVK